MFQQVMETFSLWALPVILITILTYAMFKKVPIYEVFTDGAKDGFKVAVNIIPYLVAIIVGVSMLRASGFFDMLSAWLAPALTFFNIPADIIPVMLTRSLSGSATIGLFSDIAGNPASTFLTTTLAAIMVGSSETTMYVLAVYFGSVKISKIRYALIVGLLADLMGIILAILVCKKMFG
ncbi:spore maturation protein [bacterium]|nr:spore maturation protein [bacterium]